GELHRHEVLKQAQGEIVCYLSDDDLWLPHHIEVMYSLLQKADIANTMPTHFHDGRIKTLVVDIAMPYYRNEMLCGGNRMPLSVVGHTLKMYRSLPYGWRTTPPSEKTTDTYMWQQFLNQKDCRWMSGGLSTAVYFSAFTRKTMN